uniref:Uncharacterized protein n=1 Tax=Ditylenchus dipsaci TaxID=166011 RepID=A0A915D3I1_9BILA
MIKEADGNLDSIELVLGLPLGWGEGQDLRKIFVPNPRELNLRLPSGSEMGVNEQWLPGGRLPTEHPEAIIDRIPRGKYIERWPDNTQFVVPNSVFEKIVKEADGNLDSIELALGLPLGWGEGQDLRKIFVPNPRELNLRLPSGSEMGVNEQWLPGGRLPTGHPEAIIDRIPRGKYIETKLILNNKSAVTNDLTTKFDPIKLRYHYMFLGQRGPEEYGCVKGHTLNIYDLTQQIYGRKNTWFLLPKQKKNNQPKNSRTVFIEDFNIIKLIDLKKCDRDVFEKEVTALRQIQSPFVARLKHAFLNGSKCLKWGEMPEMGRNADISSSVRHHQ